MFIHARRPIFIRFSSAKRVRVLAVSQDLHFRSFASRVCGLGFSLGLAFAHINTQHPKHHLNTLLCTLIYESLINLGFVVCVCVHQLRSLPVQLKCARSVLVRYIAQRNIEWNQLSGHERASRLGDPLGELINVVFYV